MSDEQREVSRLLVSVRDTSGLGDGFSIDELAAAGLLDPAGFSPSTTISAVERAERKVAAGFSALREKLNSGALFEPGFEERERARLVTEWRTETSAWVQNLIDHQRLVGEAIQVLQARLANPRPTWAPVQQNEAQQAFEAARRALDAYGGARELEAQLVAVLNGGRAAELDGWREALLARAADGKGDPAGSMWMARLSKALADDPPLQRQLTALTRRLEKYQEAERKAASLMHPRLVEIDQLALIESGRYGDRVAGPPTVHNEVDRVHVEVRDITDRDDIPLPRRKRIA